jgi:hypothetical protein
VSSDLLREVEQLFVLRVLFLDGLPLLVGDRLTLRVSPVLADHHECRKENRLKRDDHRQQAVRVVLDAERDPAAEPGEVDADEPHRPSERGDRVRHASCRLAMPAWTISSAAFRAAATPTRCGSIVCISLSSLRLGVRQGLRRRVRPEATVELGDDAPQLERERDLHHAGHEREGRDERQKGESSRAGMGEHDHAERRRQQPAQREQQLPPPAEREAEREPENAW